MAIGSLLSKAIDATSTSSGRVIKNTLAMKTGARAMSRIPPQIKMPTPQYYSPVSKFLSSGPNVHLMGMLGSAAVGASVGGYYNQGGWSGAIKGAIGGAVVGGIMGNAGGIYKAGLGAAQGYKPLSRTISKYSSSIADVGGAINTTEARRSFFAVGGLLGGAAFGGNRNSRRGFNQNRGSKIGR